ncbi:hypothetical protein B0H14DRAFT_3140129 [Mycena olivaceomarginata]|nr:hypothetical protein B0H14DRAFT_3140129 [Mycena olivaceomarginata]
MYARIRSFVAVGIFLGLFACPSRTAPVESTFLAPGGHSITEIHEVPLGGQVQHVGDDIHLKSANGTILHVVSNVKPAKLSARALKSGWITDARWTNTNLNSPISSFTMSWTVPPTPTTYHGQTVFLFNSIMPSDISGIVQPVLQYGPSAAGGGQFWAVASWYLWGDIAFYTPLVPVSVGQQLNGVISLTGQSGGFYNYNTQFSNIGGTSLTVNGGLLQVIATETLEAYSINAVSDYPTGTTTFFGINLRFLGSVPTVSWSVVDQDMAEGLFTTINQNGASNALITITY